jgi:hypothetical protein
VTVVDVSTNLSIRLRGLLPKMKEATLTRISAIDNPEAVTDASYFEGLQLAVSAALDHCLAVIDGGVAADGPIPVIILAQARAAARSGVSLGTVLHRCAAGHTLFHDFLMGAAAEEGLNSSELRYLMRSQATLFDRLLAAARAEHGRESPRGDDSSESRLLRRVEQLLRGEMVDTTDIYYDFDAIHIGVVVTGSVEAEAIRDLAKSLNRRALVVQRREDTLWAWFGGRQGFDTRELDRAVSAKEWSAQVSLTIGEPGSGLAGWRLTHQQAQAALPIARRSSKPVRRYAEMALLSSMARDDLLVSSLHQLYLAPLEKERDRGKTLRDTLRAYFAAERNVSSAAIALGVKRHTVTRRLRAIEEKLGQPLSVCATEVDAALKLEDLRQM